MGLKKDTSKFLSDDPTQAFILVSAVLISLLWFGKLGEMNFVNVYKWIATAYFGQYITNLSGLKKVL